MKENEDIFLYFYNTKIWGDTPMSWKLIKWKNLIKDKDWLYLYKLNEIWINRYFDGMPISYNWIENELKQTNKAHFIAGYITTINWNTIEEISITAK